MRVDSEIERWRGYANALGFVKTEDAEKDYLQEILLSELFAGSLATTLVFRGGTAIAKAYGSGRFSEDLDFILSRKEDAKRVDSGVRTAISNAGLRYQLESSLSKYRSMLRYTLKIKGPIYALTGNEQAKQTIGIDINTYERPMFAARTMRRVPIYEDIRPYLITVASVDELLADKVKAMLERAGPVARDLYDAWVLVRKYRIRPDLKAVARKMREYGKRKGERFSNRELDTRMRLIGKVWDKEMPRLVRDAPEYSVVAREFRKAMG
jgi:predicted nucleotidyltransferase component of viral defense system